jgi:Tfp pilus assembly PilM family ATPase
MPTTTRRHTLTLAGLEVPVVEVTGAGTARAWSC